MYIFCCWFFFCLRWRRIISMSLTELFIFLSRVARHNSHSVSCGDTKYPNYSVWKRRFPVNCAKLWQPLTASARVMKNVDTACTMPERQNKKNFFFWYFNRKLVQSISFKIMELINLLARTLINWWFVIFDFFKLLFTICVL